jgi:uncharacterized protein
MRSMAETISLDFGKPIALFPLAQTMLLPHAVQALHIFEPRYRQMIEHALEAMEGGAILSAAPIAMASFRSRPGGGVSASEYQQPNPPLRPAVCVGKIVQHQGLADGRHNILLQGVCRARIRQLLEPTGERLFRMAMLEPLERVTDPPPSLPGVRAAFRRILTSPRLSRLSGTPAVLEWVARRDIPMHALLELIGSTLVTDDALRYRLLAEPDPQRRAILTYRELDHIDRIVAKASEQDSTRWPKGVSWN